MLKARELLERTAESLERISAQVGYRSDAAFNRAFKRKFDTTPGAARRAARAWEFDGRAADDPRSA